MRTHFHGVMPWLATGILSVFFLVSGWWWAGQVGLSRYDEFHTAERIHQMRVSDDKVTVKRNSQMDGRKPPLHYWLGAASWSWIGNPRVAVAFWSIVYAIGCFWMLHLLARLLWPESPWIGPLAAAMLATSAYFIKYSCAGFLDSGMTFFFLMTVVGYEWARKSGKGWWLVGVGVALGFLEKTPLGLFYLPFAVLLDRLQGHAPPPWKNSGCRHAALAAALIVLAWPVSQVAMFGFLFVNRFFMQQMFDRVVLGEYGKQHGIFDFLVDMARGWPWIPAMALVGLGMMCFLWGKSVKPGQRVPGLLLVVMLAVMIVCHLRQPNYLLPLLPFVSLVAAVAVCRIGCVSRAAGVLLSLVLVVVSGWGAVRLLKDDEVSLAANRAAYESIQDIAGHLSAMGSHDGGRQRVLFYTMPIKVNLISALCYFGDLREPVEIVSPKSKAKGLKKLPDLEAGQKVLLIMYEKEEPEARPYFQKMEPVYSNGEFGLWKAVVVDPELFRKRVL